jgi:copper chaperone CopZ
VITTLRISGMTCNGCKKHVDAALRELPGVSGVEVDLANGRAKVVHDPETSPVPSLVAAVGEAGYEAAAD